MTALKLCQTLHQIAENCTVICSIHQPQGKIFALFDSLLLLKGGVIAYHGPTKNALPYFEQTGMAAYTCLHREVALRFTTSLAETSVRRLPVPASDQPC